MDHLMYAIARGSTPTLELELPFELPVASVCYATFSQDDKPVLEYSVNGKPSSGIRGAGTLTIDPDDPSILLLAMTQSDTLVLERGDADLQVRVRTYNGADTFLPLHGEIVQAQKEGVI